MINIEIHNPLQGAAFQVLYEATSPVYCHTRERQLEIEAYLARVADWARRTQSVEVASAYASAASEIRQQVEKAMKTLELGRAVHAARLEIPLPPIEPLAPDGIHIPRDERHD